MVDLLALAVADGFIGNPDGDVRVELDGEIEDVPLVGVEEPKDAMTSEAFNGEEEVRSWKGRSLCVWQLLVRQLISSGQSTYQFHLAFTALLDTECI